MDHQTAPELFHLLRESALFEKLSDEEVRALACLARIETYDPEAFIIQEGEWGDAFYLLKSGSVEVLKKQETEGVLCSIAVLSKGSCFGEGVLLGGAREASVKALQLTEVVAFPGSKIKQLPRGDRIVSEIVASFSQHLRVHLQKANQQIIDATGRELSLTRIHDEVGRVIVYVFILMAVFVYVVRLLSQATLDPLATHLTIAALIASIGCCALLIIKSSAYPLEFYGITLNKWRQHAKEAFLWTLPLLVVMFAIKWILITHVDAFAELKLFGPGESRPFVFSLFEPALNHKPYWIGLIVYTVFVPVQELIVRGCLQGCFYHFFRSTHRVLLSIVISNILFATFHNLRTVLFSFVAGALGLFWGWIYYKQKSLVGPIVSHALVGLWGLGVLNFGAILT
jgi:CRP-like cAMP-binding protein